MRIYKHGTLEEWSRRLRSENGDQYRLYSGEGETLERWAEHLSEDLHKHFEIKEGTEHTLSEWSKLIGG